MELTDLELEIQRRYRLNEPYFNERSRRIFAATEVLVLGFGGVLIVHRATGLARSTIGRGLLELRSGAAFDGRVRHQGGGRWTLSKRDPKLKEDLEQVVKDHIKGNPMGPLMWVSKSVDKIADALRSMGHQICSSSVNSLLKELDYRRLSNRKMEELGNSPDRNAQFEHINKTAQEFIEDGQPVVSVDTKKKENIGNFKNPGTDYRPQGQPDRVRVHDFVDKEKGKAAPYGVYDIADNSGFVSVGIDHDTAEFAVNSLRSWWYAVGRFRYPNARCLMITADGGGSNGSRVKLWKIELQKLADELGIEITVCHFPPGCSKWNKIEHRLFCHITQNWRGTPLVDLLTIVELIGATKTKTGLTVECILDPRTYQSGIKITEQQMLGLNIKRNDFRPDWNYTIMPNLDG